MVRPLYFLPGFSLSHENYEIIMANVGDEDVTLDLDIDIDSVEVY